MAHKVHPKAFRIRETTNWNSRWLDLKKTPEYLEEDFIIRKFLENKLKEAGIDKIEIERYPGKINIIVEAARPGLIIGRGGTGIEKLKSELENKLSKIAKRPAEAETKMRPREIRLEIREISDPWTRANLVSQWIASQIERRVPYRRTLKRALDRIMAHKEIKGARVEVAGRLDGIEIARREWLQKGRLPRQTLRAEIDYAHSEALCTYGKVGVKVWIYKGEKFER